MMVTTIRCHRSVKVKLPTQFEMTDVSIDMEARLEELDDPAECARRLCALVEGELLGQVYRHYRSVGQTPDPNALMRRYGLSKGPTP